MPVEALPMSEELVAQWHKNLLASSSKLRYLTNDRWISLDVIKQFLLGHDGDRFTVPVRDASGELKNVRRHKPNGPRKVIHLRGHGKGARLVFAEALKSDPHEQKVVTGGELDALAGWTAGFPSVCGSSGEGSVPPARELDALRGQKVALIMDSDGPGRAASLKWSKALAPIVGELRVVDLGSVKDLNLFFQIEDNDGEVLRGLIDATPVYSERRRASELLAEALRKVQDDGEGRNETGFWLARMLRDSGYSSGDAWVLALSVFQAEVEAVRDGDPYSVAEARGNIESAFSRAPSDASTIAGSRGGPLALTELGNMERLLGRHGENVRYISPSKKWMLWNGQHWAEDEREQIMVLAKDTIRDIPAEATGLSEDDAKRVRAWARQSETAAKLKATLELTRSEATVAMLPAQFDSDPMLLNCSNGTINLADGTLRAHHREDYCRRIVRVPFDPDAHAPGFETFLKQIQPDPLVRAFLQRLVGYCLTGKTDEQKFFLFHGFGANGKSTLVEILQELLGAYATFLPAEALVQSKSDRIPNDIARLNGARLVPVTEFDETASLNERLIKQLTGGDTMQARFMHGEFFDFRPQGKLILSSNHRPAVKGSDDGIWRRVLLIDFPIKIDKSDIDPGLRQRLVSEELPGILRWAVDGAVMWRTQGLNPPESILNATQGYRDSSDVLKAFVDESCFLSPTAEVSKQVLYQEFQTWCQYSGIQRPWTKIAFGKALKDRHELGLEEDRVGKNKTHVWRGLDLRQHQVVAPGRPHLRAVPSGSDASEDEAVIEPPATSGRRRPSKG
jgi:P4 family phage/plasmid primase-like protien